MISFRHHVVSLVAVFLALALGVLAGRLALPHRSTADLHDSVRSLSAERSSLRAQLAAEQGTGARLTALAARVEPAVERGVLGGRFIAVVSASSVDAGTRGRVVAALRRAGGTVTADVRLSPRLLDPTQSNTLDDLATRLVVPGVALPSGASGAQVALAEIADVLVAGPGDPSVTSDGVSSVLAGFAQAGYLGVGGSVGSRASLAVLVVPSGHVASGATAQATYLAGRLGGRAVGAAVVSAGHTASDMLATLRREPAVTDHAATVDSADTAVGRLATVLALAAAEHGDHRAYGLAPGTTAPIPPLTSPAAG